MRKSVLSVEFYERDKRDTSLHSWGIGVPPRVDNRERREAVFIDGLFSIDGIPIGVERRGAIEKWEGRETIARRGTQRKIKIYFWNRLFSAVYLFVMLFIGIILQLHGIF